MGNGKWDKKLYLILLRNAIIPPAGKLNRLLIRIITFILSVIITTTIIFGSAFFHHGLIPVISSGISFVIFTKIKKVNIFSN